MSHDVHMYVHAGFSRLAAMHAKGSGYVHTHTGTWLRSPPHQPMPQDLASPLHPISGTPLFPPRTNSVLAKLLSFEELHVF